MSPSFPKTPSPSRFPPSDCPFPLGNSPFHQRHRPQTPKRTHLILLSLAVVVTFRSPKRPRFPSPITKTRGLPLTCELFSALFAGVFFLNFFVWTRLPQMDLFSDFRLWDGPLFSAYFSPPHCAVSEDRMRFLPSNSFRPSVLLCRCVFLASRIFFPPLFWLFS